MNKTFGNTQELFEDMVKNNQSFIKGHFVTCDSNKEILVEECTIYRLVKMSKNKLEFHSNKFGGSNLYINGSILAAEKIDKADNCISEYKISIKGREEPFVLMGCKK